MINSLKTENLLNLEHTIAKELFNEVNYPWEALERLSDFIKKLGPQLDKNIYEEKGDNIWVAKSAVIAPTACLTGPLIIGENSEIRHCAFIRGSAIIGENCVVGNSTEIKNSVLFDNVQTPHYNYIGDSVLGYKSHTGAGVITSNVKSDKTLVTVLFNGEKIESNRKKFGAIIGDNVEVGCNSVLNPGTVIGRNSNVYPLSMVRGYISENSIYKKAGEVTRKHN